jgi:hypothetical protein
MVAVNSQTEIVDETTSEHHGHGAFTMPWLFAEPASAVLA